MAEKLECYRPAECCGEDCSYLGHDESQPCWGTTDVIDEDWSEDNQWWIHGCEGHYNMRWNGQYIPKKSEESRGVAQSG